MTISRLGFMPFLHCTFLFGGISCSACPQSEPRYCYADLWKWDGRDWTNVSVAPCPSPRFAAAMAFDPQQENLLLFGGDSGEAFNHLADTWRLQNGNWSRIKTNAFSRPDIDPCKLCYDSARRVSLL